MSKTTRALAVDPNDPDPAALTEAAGVLRRGGLVAFATETVYGLGADATDPAAVARIFEVKGRPPSNPLIVHADGPEMARRCVEVWPEAAEALAAAFWPGPLTLVLPRPATVPDIVTAGQDTVGVRVPRPAVARRLIEATGRPIAAPSANRSNGVSPTTARHVLDDLDGRIDLVLDSGPTAVGLESTVLGLATIPYRILRPGPIVAADIERILAVGRVQVRSSGDPEPRGPLTSPGQLPVHYAPRTPALRFDDAGALAGLAWPDRAALLVVGVHALPPIPDGVHVFELPTTEVAARDLYAVLRRCDALGLDLIAVVLPADLPEWCAVRDRLRRATRSFEAGGG